MWHMCKAFRDTEKEREREGEWERERAWGGEKGVKIISIIVILNMS